MARDDAEDRNQERAGGADRPQDPIVDRVRPDPALPPEQTVSLVGFLGESDRSGRRRLYFTRDINYYAEFRVEDVLHMVPIPAGEQPFRGEEATRVTLRREAPVEFVRTHTAVPRDEFDLDVQLGGRRLSDARRRGVLQHTDCNAATCGGATQCGTQCVTCGDTQCFTRCDEVTCGGNTDCDCQTQRTPPPIFC